MADHKHRPLAEQVMVITGASSGIGLATAEAAAREGAKLVLAARSGDTLKQIAARLGQEHAGCQAIAVTADVGSREDLQRVVVEAMTHFGRIDTWINDAGVSIYGRLDEVSEADSRRLFDTNFWGVVNGSLAALPQLRQSGGALINVGGEVSDAGTPWQGMYSASKHAVKGFTDALRVEVEELEKAPVTVTLIQPTAVDTPYPQHARNYMDREPRLPTPRIEPQEVARAILKAAVEGGRDIKVGAAAMLSAMTSKLAPSLADKLSAKQAARQQEDEPPRDPEGALHRPSHDGRIHGDGHAARH